MAAEQRQELAAAIHGDVEPAQDHFLVRLVADAESPLEPCVIHELAQHRQAKCVNRAACDLLGALAQAQRDLFGRAIGECDSADAVRIDTGGDEMLDSGDETEGLAGTRSGDDKDRADARFYRATLLGQGSEAHPLLNLWSNVTSVTVWHVICLSFNAVIALLSILVLATWSPVRLVLDSGLLVRLQTLAAGLHNEIVLCLTGTTTGDTAVATGFTMPDPQLSASDHATFGPCPKETVAIWHNHPLENRSGTHSADAPGFARPRGDPNMTPRELCALSETDIRTAATSDSPFIVVAVDRDTWCWWSREQVRNLAARNALRGDPVPGQSESRPTRQQSPLTNRPPRRHTCPPRSDRLEASAAFAPGSFFSVPRE